MLGGVQGEESGVTRLLQTENKSSSLNSIGLDVCPALGTATVFGAALTVDWSLVSLR